MANRFAVADTLGFQLYNDYLQRDIAEKRRKEEQERLAKQRKKAKSHGAFGQTLSTLGQVGGAIAGGMTGGVPGAIAGAQLGQAGASALFNIAPNIGGTQPSGNNPYYDAPSDMQRFGSVFNAGLQAYGQYSQAAKAEAMERVKNDLTAAIQSQGNAFKSMGRDDIQAMLEGLDSYKDAQGLFGESLIDSSTASSIANNVYDTKGQKALKHLEFLMSTKDSEQKSGAIREWLNSYGTAHSDLLPKGGIEAITAGIGQGIDDRAQTKAQNNLAILSKQNAIALQALQLVNASAELTPQEKQAQKAMEVQVKALSLGTSVDKLKENPAYAELDNVPDKLKPLATAYKNVVELSVATNERALAAKTQTQQQDLAKWHFEQTRQILKDMPAVPENEGLRQQLSEMMNASAAKLGFASEGEGGLQKQLDYSNVNVEEPEEDEKLITNAYKLISQLSNVRDATEIKSVADVEQALVAADPERQSPIHQKALELLKSDPKGVAQRIAADQAAAKKPGWFESGSTSGHLYNEKDGLLYTGLFSTTDDKSDSTDTNVAATNTAPAPTTSSSDKLELVMDDEPKQVAQAPRQKITTPIGTVPGQMTSQSQPALQLPETEPYDYEKHVTDGGVILQRPPEATFLPTVTNQHDAMGAKRKGQKMPLYMLDQDPMVSESAPVQLDEVPASAAAPEPKAAAPKGKFDDLLFSGDAPDDPYGEMAQGWYEEQEAAYKEQEAAKKAGLTQAEAPTSELEAEVQQAEAQAETPAEKVKLKLNVLREVSKRVDGLKTRINDAGGWDILTDDYKDRMSSVMKVVQDTGERLVSLTESLNNAKDPSAQELYKKSIQIKLDQADLLFKKINDLETEFDEMLVSQGKAPPVPKEIVDEVAEATASTMDTTPTSIESLKAVYNVHLKDLQDYHGLTQKFIDRLSQIQTSDRETNALIDLYISRAKSLQGSMSGFPALHMGPGRVKWDYYDTDEELKLKVDQQNTDRAIKGVQSLIAKYNKLRSDYATDYNKLGAK